MKRNKILKIAFFPLVLGTILAFTNLPPQKNNNNKSDKNNKSQEQAQDKGKGQGNKENGNNDNNHGQGNDRIKSNNDKQGNNSGQGNNNHKGNSNRGKDNAHNSEMKHGNGNYKTMNGKRDATIDWNLNNFGNWKHPKDRKKVTICHNPSGNGSNNGVTINVSENALQAHLNHGDQTGNCTMDYSDRWSSNYVKSRENVYNTYEQTWETMSYSEALLKLAMQKLLGVRTNFEQNRSTYTSQELQRREALIYDLQNNVTSLENQLDVTRQRLDSDVNIIIQL